MKLRTTGKFLGLLLLAIGCEKDEEPSYPVEPHIEFKSIQFGETEEFLEPDSLLLSFHYTDGDGNLGFLNYPEPDSYIINYSYPYHARNYFLEAANNEVAAIGTHKILTDSPNAYMYPVILTVLRTDGHTGKLVTLNTRKKEGYSYLPELSEAWLGCSHYTREAVYIKQSDAHILDESVRTYQTAAVDEMGIPYLRIQDTLYFQRNENHFNLEVDFLVKQGDGSFAEFDWVTNYCASFEERFSEIGKGTITRRPFYINAFSTSSGIITYEMRSVGFRMIFGNQVIKLRFKIRDRALNESNEIETPEFTLDAIK